MNPPKTTSFANSKVFDYYGKRQFKINEFNHLSDNDLPDLINDDPQDDTLRISKDLSDSMLNSKI